MEIERKFIVDSTKWNSLPKPKGIRIAQGYLSTSPEKTVRVRVKDDKAFLTVKGEVKGISREEIEFEIPTDKAYELLQKFCGAVIQKTRYIVEHDGKKWEVDVFENDNSGLIIAELELNSEDESFSKPDWATHEVTGDKRYYNSYISENPFKIWK